MVIVRPPFSRKSPITRALAEVGQPQAAGAPAASRTAEEKAASRARLWNLKDKFHCPLIGTCLAMDELLRIARRHAFAGNARDDYLLHVKAVGCAGSRNPVSEDLNRHFERKYAGYIARFDCMKTAEELLAFWKAHYENGEVAGPMWALFTHRAADDELRHAVYADVHMLSHQVGAGLAADARRLTWLTRRNAELAATLERGRLDAAGAERGRALQAALRESQDRTAALLRERDTLAAERDALERLMLVAESDEAACNVQCNGCENRAAGRCVLCVGGRTTLLSQYRALAGRLGIRLVHHDGGLEESLSRLPDLINGADAVLCPTDCVSHAAYYKLKQHCKRTGKPCLLFKGAGVSGFAVALARLAAGQASIAGSETIQH